MFSSRNNSCCTVMVFLRKDLGAFTVNVLYVEKTQSGRCFFTLLCSLIQEIDCTLGQVMANYLVTVELIQWIILSRGIPKQTDISAMHHRFQARAACGLLKGGVRQSLDTHYMQVLILWSIRPKTHTFLHTVHDKIS